MSSLENKRKENADVTTNKKRELKQEEVMSVKQKDIDLEKVVVTLKNGIDECSVEASKKEDYESMKLCL